MRFAINQQKERVEPSPNLDNCICDICKKPVIPKCGSINIWHWAHYDLSECDSWSEGETDWHRNLKDKCIKEAQEITIGRHRADLVNYYFVIELQHSPISFDEIIEREQYYKNMIWVFDMRDKIKNMNFIEENKFCHWKWMPKNIRYCTKKIFIDVCPLSLEDNLIIQITKFTHKGFYFKNINFNLMYLKNILRGN
jgi:competence CoiA-like predicted nuclease